MIILLHTSKTMRSPGNGAPLRQPELINKAILLSGYLKTLSPTQLQACMHISPTLALAVQRMYSDWNAEPAKQSLAIDSFVGDIYSGLRAGTLSITERDYADEHLRILSGLYGIVRPYDGIRPYRLEMGYKLPAANYRDLYRFWGDTIANTLPPDGLIIDLSALEYSRTITSYLDARRIIAPQFLTLDPATGEGKFVVVHTKIARGAFARWLITSRITDVARLKEFADIGYRFDAGKSTPEAPVFVCHQFGGKGLSMRLERQ